MKQQLIDELTALKSSMVEAGSDAYMALVNLQEAKRKLQEAEDVLVISGEIDGKNAEIRAAQLRTFTSRERETVVEAEEVVDGTKTTLANRQAELRINIALVELIKGVS